MITTAYVAGLLTTVCLVALVRLASNSPRLEPRSQPEPALDEREDEEAPCHWRKSWKLRTQTCLDELRSADDADDCTARMEALRWARRLHFERRSHAFQDEEALEDAEAFWEEVNDVLRPGGPG